MTQQKEASNVQKRLYSSSSSSASPVRSQHKSGLSASKGFDPSRSNFYHNYKQLDRAKDSPTVTYLRSLSKSNIAPLF